MRNLIIFSTLVMLAACGTPQGIEHTEKLSKAPNIVLVITDDQGYGDLSIHGNPIVKTPHLDALAKQSTRLDNYHVSPTCAPTRGALMTGRTSNRTGVWHTIMGRSLLRDNEVTLPQMLASAGYQTAMIGKWHLGDNFPYRPHDRGFQHAYYHGAGGVGQTPDYWDNSYFDDVYFRNGKPEPSKGFVTDVFFDEAIKYIDQFKQTDKPFFVYLSTNAPHGPMHAPADYAAKYENYDIPTKIKHFFGMITNIDDNVAKLRRYLEVNNLADNTIFMFTTDNGTSAGDKVFNAGMRGKKNSEYDGGHRVPMFIHWPAKGLNEGRMVNQITGHVDIMPSLLKLAGVEAPEGVKFDGVDISQQLLDPQAQWPDRVMITDSQRIYMPKKWRKSAVMTDQWRLVNGKQLFDMYADPQQQHDIAAQHPAVVEELTDAYNQWWTEIEPTFTQTAPLFVGDDKANPVTITSHDWLGYNAAVPWNQRSIRRAIREKDGVHKSFWLLDIRQAGNYKLSLRRWPEEINHPIRAGLEKGEAVAGDKAFRAVNGEGFDARTAHIDIQGKSLSLDVQTDDKSVSFMLPLDTGKTEFKAYFSDAKGHQLGAYYVHIERLASE